MQPWCYSNVPKVLFKITGNDSVFLSRSQRIIHLLVTRRTSTTYETITLKMMTFTWRKLVYWYRQSNQIIWMSIAEWMTEFVLQLLSQKYSDVRKTRGDGNCFYRAFGFGYLEYLLTNKEKFTMWVVRRSLCIIGNCICSPLDEKWLLFFALPAPIKLQCLYTWLYFVLD